MIPTIVTMVTLHDILNFACHRRHRTRDTEALTHRWEDTTIHPILRAPNEQYHRRYTNNNIDGGPHRVVMEELELIITRYVI